MGLSTPSLDAMCGLPWPGGLRHNTWQGDQRDRRHEAVSMIQEREAETSQGSPSCVGDTWKRETEGNAWIGASRYEKAKRCTQSQKAKRYCSAWITGWRKGTRDLIHAQRKRDGKSDTRTYHHARITSQHKARCELEICQLLKRCAVSRTYVKHQHRHRFTWQQLLLERTR